MKGFMYVYATPSTYPAISPSLGVLYVLVSHFWCVSRAVNILNIWTIYDL